MWNQENNQNNVLLNIRTMYTTCEAVVLGLLEWGRSDIGLTLIHKSSLVLPFGSIVIFNLRDKSLKSFYKWSISYTHQLAFTNH